MSFDQFEWTELIFELEQEAKTVVEFCFRKFSRVTALFSGGKDSRVLIHFVDEVATQLNKDYTILHVDTGKNFPEMLDFRDKLCAELKGGLSVVKVPQRIAEKDKNRYQSRVLNQFLKDNPQDIVFGGGRRDEDPARRKETLFSKRKNGEGWQPEKMAIEFPPHFPTQKCDDEHFRVFPLSNWTEDDIWTYIGLKELEVCSLYFAHLDLYQATQERVRYRTIGDKTNSTPLKSYAQTAFDVFIENQRLGIAERSGRRDDEFDKYAMEIRKREGYF